MWTTNVEQTNVWTKLKDGTYIYVDYQNGRREMDYWEMLKAISPYDYSIKNKVTNHTELRRELQDDANMSL